MVEAWIWASKTGDDGPVYNLVSFHVRSWGSEAAGFSVWQKKRWAVLRNDWLVTIRGCSQGWKGTWVSLAFWRMVTVLLPWLFLFQCQNAWPISDFYLISNWHNWHKSSFDLWDQMLGILAWWFQDRIYRSVSSGQIQASTDLAAKTEKSWHHACVTGCGTTHLRHLYLGYNVF